VRMDQGQFDQAILNLAVNARDAMPSGGRLSLSSGVELLQVPTQYGTARLQPGAYVVIDVADSGCGIPESVIDNIFEPFFTTKHRVDGAGLGLSTVSDIVRRIGGAVSVRSAPGEGACFRILIPAQPEAGEAPSLADVAAAPADPPVAVSPMVNDARSRRILLVDDEEIIRKFAARALRSRGYEVLEAADGETALDALSPGGPKVDLLLADLMLPGADGRAVVEHALTLRPEMRAIVISAHIPEEPWRSSSAEAGRVLLLSKPFTLAELAAAVKRALDG
jgi:two-component system, cell cycle sensor histidine kinase and response regulator CckA